MLPNIVTNGLKRAASLPASIAFAVTNAKPVFERLERWHEEAIRDLNMHHDLSPLEAQIVDGLEQNGVFVTSLSALGFEQSKILRVGQSLAGDMQRRVRSMGNELPVMIENTPDDILTFPEIFRWGLNDTIMRIAESYMHQHVAYDGPLLFHTPPDGKETGTRQWHKDREDRRMIKLALYLNDVDEDGGPFEILNKESRKKRRPDNFRPLFTEELRRSMAGRATPRNNVVCTGPAGTLVFADAARFFHRGRPAMKRERSAIFWSYFSRLPRHPYFCARSRLSRAQLLALTDGLGPEKRAAAMWRDHLPLAARIIPPSLM
jgi:hypothetical protein